MSDLSSYISFLVKADVTNVNTPLWILTDNSVYPTGVAATLYGIFTITQPDGITRTGTFSSPDIIYSGGALQPASIALRIDTNNFLQQGQYTIKYEVSATGYLPTTLSKTFTISYSKPAISLTEIFDIFTPSLSYHDGTSYTAGNFTQTVVRSWSAVVGTVGTVTGSNSADFDLKYGAYYYDAAYVITFGAVVTYQSSAYSYLSIKDVFSKIVNTDAYTPPTSAQLLADLTSLKTKLDALINSCQRYDEAKADYEYAYTLYAHAQKRICANDKVGVDTYISEIINILNNNSVLSRTHTNTAISAYSPDCGGSIIPVSQWILEVVAGQASAIASGIIVGSLTFTNSNIAGRYIQVRRNDAPITGIDPLNGGMFYTKIYSSDTITFSTPIQDTEVISINTI